METSNNQQSTFTKPSFAGLGIAIQYFGAYKGHRSFTADQENEKLKSAQTGR